MDEHDGYAPRLSGVNHGRRVVAENHDARLLANRLNDHTVRVACSPVGDVQPTAGRVPRRTFVVVARDFACLLRLNQEIDAGLVTLECRDSKIKMGYVVLDRLPNLVLKLARVIELAQEATGLNFLAEGAKTIELRGVDIVRQRSCREVEVDRFSLVEGSFNLLNGAGYGVRCRRSKSTAKQGEDDVGLVDTLCVYECLRVAAHRGNSVGLPSPGLQDDMLGLGVRAVPSIDRRLDGVAGVGDVGWRRDHDSKDSCCVGHEEDGSCIYRQADAPTGPGGPAGDPISSRKGAREGHGEGEVGRNELERVTGIEPA